MRASSEMPRGIFVPPEQVEVYIHNGWTVVDDLNPHHVLMMPPTHHRPRDRAEGRADDS